MSQDFDSTSLQTAIANTLASSTASVAFINAQLTARYLSAFADWKVSVDAGRIDNSNPPKPPAGYQLSAPDGYGFQWPEQGTAPVCPMPPIPEDHTKAPAPTLPAPQNVMNVPPGDTMPVGYIAVAPDGTKWQKQSSPTPFGVAYFYARVA